MSLDTAVQFSCQPRTHFGPEGVLEGTQRILELLRARGRAGAAEDLARQHGNDPESTSITVTENYGGKPVQRNVTLAELRAAAAPLDTQQASCHDCPANVLGSPYGCFVTLHYPIPATAETWLLGRLAPSGSTAWNSCALYLADQGIRGENARTMRSRGFFELRAALERRHKTGLFRSQCISTDQLFEFFVRGGEALLEPPVCAMFLFWFNCLGVQGAIPGREGLDSRLQRFEALVDGHPEQRAAETSLLLDPVSDEGAGEFAALFGALYRAWVHNVPLYYWS